MPRHLPFAKELQLVRGQYLEIPRLCLSQRQIERLWGLDAITAKRVIRTLVDLGFLQASINGCFERAVPPARRRRMPIADVGVLEPRS